MTRWKALQRQLWASKRASEQSAEKTPRPRESAPADAVAPYTAQERCCSPLDSKELLEPSCGLTGACRPSARELAMAAPLEVPMTAAGTSPHAQTLPLEARALLILHASVTGTAIDVAERIGRRARREGWAAQVKSVAQFNPVSPFRSLVREAA